MKVVSLRDVSSTVSHVGLHHKNLFITFRMVPDPLKFNVTYYNNLRQKTMFENG